MLKFTETPTQSHRAFKQNMVRWPVSNFHLSIPISNHVDKPEQNEKNWGREGGREEGREGGREDSLGKGKHSLSETKYSLREHWKVSAGLKMNITVRHADPGEISLARVREQRHADRTGSCPLSYTSKTILTKENKGGEIALPNTKAYCVAAKTKTL